MSVLPASNPEGLMARFTIPGHQPRKSNSRQIARGRIIKSEKALRYEEMAVTFLRLHKNLQLDISVPVELSADIYYPNTKCDLSDELLCDVLEKGGVLRNDNLVRRKHIYWAGLDKKYPRCEIEIRILKDYPLEWFPRYTKKEALI